MVADQIVEQVPYRLARKVETIDGFRSVMLGGTLIHMLAWNELGIQNEAVLEVIDSE